MTRRVNLAALSLSLVLMTAAFTPVRAADPITKAEIRTDRPERTARRLRDQLWGMFRKEDHRRKDRPRRALDAIWLSTKPQGTHVKGLCRYDSVRVEFAPVSRADLGADTPVEASGIKSTSYYRFLTPPADSYHPSADFRSLSGAGACASIDTEKLSFFAAPDEQVATNGYLAFRRLQQQLREQPGTLPLNCDLFPTEKQDCASLILGFGQDDLTEIERCHSDIPGQCFAIESGNRRILLFQIGEDISRVILDSLIVLSHELID